MDRYIVYGDSTDPRHNLAVETLLFESCEGAAVLYLWQNRNTVVIGRHQNAWAECRVALLEQEGGTLARRSTGGGAVFHDMGNLNFTFIVPREIYDVRRQLGVVKRAVAAFGIEAEFTGRNDLVASGGAKFSGNAFKLTKVTGMHHGTLLVHVDVDRLSRYLVPSADKLKAKGIQSVRSRVCNLTEFAPSLTVDALREALSREFESEYGSAEVLPIAGLDAERLRALEEAYGSWDFRLGKALPFDAALTHRFPWGGVTVEMSLKHGRVESARVFSDAMEDDMIDRIAPALIGARYENIDLASAIEKGASDKLRDVAEWLKTEPLG